MSNYYFLTLTTILTACALASLRLYRPTSHDSRLYVVVTTTIIADAVQSIAGDAVRLNCLMGPGVDPHLYRATEGDMRAVHSADVVLFNGLDLEGKMSHLFSRNSSTIAMYAVTTPLAPQQLLYADQSDAIDPHVWHDPTLFCACCDYVTEILVQHAPEHASQFRNNYTQLRRRLLKLDEWVVQQCKLLDPPQKVLATAHDAFAYFARRYGFEVISLQGISTQTQVGLKDTTTISDRMIAQQIPTLFTESSTLDKPLQAIVLACDQRGWPVRLGHELYSDALGAPDSDASSYEQMMRYNVSAIVSGLMG